MSGSKSASTDPSMDDILASIRKIISDDEARQQANGGAAGSPGREDVLLLTDLVEEPQSGDKPGVHRSAAAPIPLPRVEPTPADAPQPSIDPAADASLLGPAVAAAATQAFARLNQAVQSSVPVPSAPDPGPPMSAGGKTMEDLVKEMLRPMLKDWLDRNLPAIVERYVEREVVRLTRR